MARTKQTARKREWRGAQAQRRPASASSFVAEAAVTKRAPNSMDPGPLLSEMFDRMKDRVLDGSRLMDGPNVSLEGIEDMAKDLDDLKAYINRAYAKEKWKDCAFDGHEIKSISMPNEQLALVLDDEQPGRYDPGAEPVFAVYSADGDYRRGCTVTTDRNNTYVDMGDFGSYQLAGGSKKGHTYWTFIAGEDCDDTSVIYHRS